MDANRRPRERYYARRRLPGRNVFQPGKLPAVRSAHDADTSFFTQPGPEADVAMSVHRSAVSTTDQRFGSRCSGWRLIGRRHEPHRWPALDSADGGSALFPEEESVSRALVRRTLLPSPC